MGACVRPGLFEPSLARLGSLKITCCAASDLRISHRKLHRLNRVELTSDCAKTVPKNHFFQVGLLQAAQKAQILGV